MLNLKKVIRNVLRTIARTATTATIASGWTGYSSGVTPLIVKQGNVVHFQWVCKPTSDVTLNTTGVPVCTIPEGYRPTRQITQLCQGSNTSVFLVSVEAGGSVNISRLRENANANGAYTTGTSSMWFPICLTWVI